MNRSVSVTVPGGFWINGTHYRDAELRALTGSEEAFLAEVGQGLLPVQRTTTQLARCLVRLGPLDRVTEKMVQMLTVGDREALLLHLRRLTFGDSLQCITICPNLDCGEKMDLEVKASRLLLPQYNNAQPTYETTVSHEDVVYRVRFHLPTGEDQEEAAIIALRDPDAVTELILRRCILQISSDAGELIDEIPTAVSKQLPSIIAGLDPQAELMLNLSCPVCGHAFSVILDTSTYFFQEVANCAENLYREVHLLALHYHWSEADIMDMTSQRRRAYLDLLDQALRDAVRR